MSAICQLSGNLGTLSNAQRGKVTKNTASNKGITNTGHRTGGFSCQKRELVTAKQQKKSHVTDHYSPPLGLYRPESEGSTSIRLGYEVPGGKGTKRHVEEGLKEWQDVERGLEAMKSAVVISGPESFIKRVSGEKMWRGGHGKQGKIEQSVLYHTSSFAMLRNQPYSTRSTQSQPKKKKKTTQERYSHKNSSEAIVVFKITHHLRDYSSLRYHQRSLGIFLNLNLNFDPLVPNNAPDSSLLPLHTPVLVFRLNYNLARNHDRSKAARARHNNRWLGSERCLQWDHRVNKGTGWGERKARRDYFGVHLSLRASTEAS